MFNDNMTLAAATTSQGNPAQRIEELGRIILAYSDVTEKLQQSQQRLEQTVRTLRDELSEKNRLLERRNRLAALGEMAAGMAHEIRNPLGGIQLYASLLARDMEGRPESVKLIEKISGGVRRLEALVSQVLQFTREMRANLAPANLRDVIDEALGLASQAIERKSIRVELGGPAPLPVRLDRLLMGQALLNLVLNAAESMNEGGQLRVRYGPPSEQARASQFWLTVEDDGAGIPGAVLDRIFNPFFTTRDTGTGLGLAIVHRVVEAHDGAVTATNRAEGGARFEIRV
jgi:signal transduction histidine kinase